MTKKNDEELKNVTGGLGFPPCENCKKMFDYTICSGCVLFNITSIVQGDYVKHFECGNGFFEPLNYDTLNKQIVK